MKDGRDRPGRRRDQFIREFEGLILSGRFEPGDRLPPERELAEGMGASRPVVHEALGELEKRGLVRIENRRGIFVTDWRRSGSVEMLLSLINYGSDQLSPRLFDSLLEMRVLFETETARLAALKRSESQLDDIECIVARERLLKNASPREIAALDYEFHLSIALASGNAIYPLLMNSLRRVYELILDRFYEGTKVVPEILKLHIALAAAIARSEADRAVAVMRGILEYGEKNLRLILSDQRGKEAPKSGP